MVAQGLIKNENMVRMIDTRKQMEKDIGYTTHTIKERDNSNLKIAEFRKKKGEEQKAEVEALLNPVKITEVQIAKIDKKKEKVKA